MVWLFGSLALWLFGSRDLCGYGSLAFIVARGLYR